MLRRLPLLVLLIFLLAACQPASAAPATSAPTRTPPRPAAATATIPAATATSTQPPAPSASPSPSPSPTAADTPTVTPPARTTLLFTGVIVPARCVQAAIDERGDFDYPYAEVRPTIEQADLAVGTFNATMSTVPTHTGCIPTYVLVGSPENADAMARAGFDVMSVATNHIKDCGRPGCGDQSFFDTLENLRRVNILPVGAGADHEAAMQPVVVTVNGVRFGIVSAWPDRTGRCVCRPGSPRHRRAEQRELEGGHRRGA